MLNIDEMYDFIKQRPHIMRNIKRLISNGSDDEHTTKWIRDLYGRIFNLDSIDWIEVNGSKKGNAIFKYFDEFVVGRMIEVVVFEFIKEQLSKMRMTGKETQIELLDLIHKYKLDYLPYSYILYRIKRIHMKYQGKQFILEGIDRAGKSTIFSGLKRMTIGFKFAFEPGFTEDGAKLRERVLTDSTLSSDERNVLFIEDRKLTFKEAVEPALSEGHTIILDRSFLTGLSYRRAEGLSMEQVQMEYENTLKIYNCTAEEFKSITTIVLFDINNAVYEQRKPHGELDVTEQVSMEMVSKRRDAYIEILDYLDLDYFKINGANSFEYNMKMVKKITGTMCDKSFR